MNRALFSGVSGLRAFQTWLDVIGNNVANVNTPGFKSQRAEFADVLSQLDRIGGAPGSGGSSETAQIGLGVAVTGTTTNWSQGSLLNTGRLGDVAIQGDGFFMVEAGGETLYTRAGGFRFDANGTLVDPSGAYVLGWNAETDGSIIDGNVPTRLVIDPQSTIPPAPTTTLDLGGRLPAGTAIGDTVTSQGTIYDTLGEIHQIEFRWTKTAANTWDQEIYDDQGNQLAPGAVQLDFDGASGALINPAPGAEPVYDFTPTNGADPMQFTTTFGSGTGSPLTQTAGAMTASMTSRDGSVSGELRALAISQAGDIMATFSNGETRRVARLAIALFNNNGALEKTGDNHYRSNPGTGAANIGSAGVAARGMLAPSFLENSNVDLSQEFTNLIVAQRGFQANTRVVTTADEMLAELINLKR